MRSLWFVCSHLGSIYSPDDPVHFHCSNTLVSWTSGHRAHPNYSLLDGPSEIPPLVMVFHTGVWLFVSRVECRRSWEYALVIESTDPYPFHEIYGVCVCCHFFMWGFSVMILSILLFSLWSFYTPLVLVSKLRICRSWWNRLLSRTVSVVDLDIVVSLSPQVIHISMSI